MNYDEVKVRLNEVFCDTFDDESIRIYDEMTAHDLDEWDSLTHITLVLGVERKFGVTLKASEVGSLDNVGAMIKLLMDRTCV